ncbi:hypothetical protein BDV93DRAFT_555721 [Ceratobasidium sp. AG-I]|nr:hypothetical protein BDV93DRAFT_555721 [Ceratobasidium sp. AG-I]
MHCLWCLKFSADTVLIRVTDDFDKDDDYNPDDVQDNENFGVPDDDQAPDVPQHRFQFPLDDMDPDDDLDDKDNDPGACFRFAAFDEPSLI